MDGTRDGVDGDMGLLRDTAEWFKSRKTRIQRWYKDDEGKYAFRVEPKPGEVLLVSAVSQTHKNGEISAMRKLVKRAEDADAMLLIRVRDDFLVYDPSTFTKRNREGTIRDDRKARGEQWLRVPKDWGADFRAYMDGRDEPRTSYGDLRDHGVKL